MKQKSNLFTKIDDPKNDRWQKDAWKIERKFEDWNIRQKIAIEKPQEDGAAALAAALLGQQNDHGVSPAPKQAGTGTNA